MFPRITVLPLAALMLAALPLRGEDKPATSPKAAPPQATSSPTGTEVDPADNRATSSAMLRNIASTLPKFDPKPAAKEPAANGPAPETTSGPAFVLPTYIVRESRPIEKDEVMTDKAREAAIVKRYVGAPSDLDVALNKYTINNTIWKRIPILGRISSFASMTYGERISLDYSKLEAQRKYTEALGVSADLPPAKEKSDDKSK